MPEFQPPEAEKIMVLAPHPDDEVLGCGGTIAIYTSMGKKVLTVFLSSGEAVDPDADPKQISRIRREEASQAARLLKTEDPIFLGYPDGALSEHSDRILTDLTDITSWFGPDIIFSPSPLDHHEDHLSTSQIALKIASAIPCPLSWYEVYNTIRFNTVVDITEVIDIKKAAILKYHHSLLGMPELFFHSISSLNAYRSFYTQKRGFYEAFQVITPEGIKEDLMNWLTYGQANTSPGKMLFTQMKGLDTILHELYVCHARLNESKEKLNEVEHLIKMKEQTVQEQAIFIQNLQASISWRLISKFYSLRDRLLPEGSRRRMLYNSLIGRLKG